MLHVLLILIILLSPILSYYYQFYLIFLVILNDLNFSPLSSYLFLMLIIIVIVWDTMFIFILHNISIQYLPELSLIVFCEYDLSDCRFCLTASMTFLSPISYGNMLLGFSGMIWLLLACTTLIVLYEFKVVCCVYG